MTGILRAQPVAAAPLPVLIGGLLPGVRAERDVGWWRQGAPAPQHISTVPGAVPPRRPAPIVAAGRRPAPIVAAGRLPERWWTCSC